MLQEVAPVGHVGEAEIRGRDDLFAAIRAGGGGRLRKASDRVLADKPVDTQSALLDEIRKGRNLKKVVVQKASPAKGAPSDALGGLSVGAILARRAALADSDSDSDDDEWDD